MEIKATTPPREFEVGYEIKHVLKDCAHIKLAPNEIITFKGDDNSEYDITRKDWGYYATPSTNGRLKSFGIRTVLVQNRDSQYYVLLVEKSKIESFNEYIENERMAIVCWLDENNDLEKIAQLFN